MSLKPIVAALSTLLVASAALADFVADPALVAAAKQEGEVIIYTANQLESEQVLAAKFNERYPDIRVEIVRAPGSRLVARIEAEAASGNLRADVLEFSDSGLAVTYEKLFADYAPANAEAYPAAVRAVSPKFWPKTSWGYALCYNKALVAKPPVSWSDLGAADNDNKMGWLPAGAGGTSWTLAMFQRQQLGEDEWQAVAAKQPSMYPSDAPLLAAVIRGEVRVAPLKTNTIIPSLRDGAPIGIVYPTEGVPVTVSSAGISATAPHPNAAKLFMDWVLSDEGQAAWVEIGGVTTLQGGALPEGAAADTKFWLPDVTQYRELRDSWIAAWNDTFNYRQ